jgi:hypothetical protein
MADPTPIASASWFPVLTLLLGFVTASISDWLRDRRAGLREREARETGRREQLFQRRTTFQRQTLLELQEEVVIDPDHRGDESPRQHGSSRHRRMAETSVLG